MNDAVTCPENKIDPTTDALIGKREISMLIFLHAILCYHYNDMYVWQYTNTIQIFMRARDFLMSRFLT